MNGGYKSIFCVLHKTPVGHEILVLSQKTTPQLPDCVLAISATGTLCMQILARLSLVYVYWGQSSHTIHIPDAMLFTFISGEITLLSPLDDISVLTHVGDPVLLTVIAEEVKVSTSALSFISSFSCH
jgi:hypothetical protein